MILITGATGRTGRCLVERIRDDRVPARALVRDPAKAGALREQGLEVVIGDLADEASLGPAVDGIERALLLTANGEGQWAQERAFIEAARAAGVRQVVKISAIGADAASDASLKRYHGLAEDLLRRAPLAHTIVQANFYMHNLLGLAPAIGREDAFALPMGEGRVGAVDLRDVADALLAALTQPGHENRSYLLTGPEVLSFADIAETFSDVLGRTIRYVDLPPEAFRAQLLRLGQPAWNVEATLQLFALIRQDRNACVTGDVAALTGRQPRSLRDFVQDHADRFG